MLSIKYKLIPFLLLLFILLMAPLFTQATGIGDVISDLDKTAQHARITQADQAPVTIYDIVGRFIKLALTFIGVFFLVLIIYGGITWMTAGGNTEKVKKASSLISQAAVGLIIVISAYLITNFIVFQVIGKTTTGDSTTQINSDQPCIDAGGECQANATVGDPCTLSGGGNGTYTANLCLSDPSSNYLCCKP